MANTSKKRKSTAVQSIFQVVADMMTRDDHEEIDIRFQRGSEMSQVARIDRLCFGAASWPEEKLLKKAMTNLYVLKVAVCGDEVVGYMAYRLNADHIKLVRLAVLPDARRRKIGTRLVEQLKEKMERVKYLRSVVCEVPDDCLSIQLMLKNAGFRAVEILKKYDSEFYRMIHQKQKGEPNYDDLFNAGGDQSGSH